MAGILLRGRVVVAAILLVGAGGMRAQAPRHWVGSWASAQQLAEPQNSLPTADLHDATLRQVVHLSVGGTVLRVHLSNAFGTAPMHVTAVHLAKALPGGKIDMATDKVLSFGGAKDVVIPAGAEYLSDAIEFPMAALSDLTVTLHMDDGPAQQTGHPGSRATSYLVHGDLVSAAELSGAKTVEHWYFLAGVDVAGAAEGRSVVTLGDSITDGHGATTNENDRWPDVLAKRLQADKATREIGVLNAGIGGNRVLLDGLASNALARFDRDVLAPAGVRYVVLLEGVNDLGVLTRDKPATKAEHEEMVRQMIAAYGQMIERAHVHGIKMIGATITPYTGSDYYHPAAESEADRQAINAWIRTPGHFDAVVDFDKAVRDPTDPKRMLPAYDSGDHLHPSAKGYEVMGGAVPLTLFAK